MQARNFTLLFLLMLLMQHTWAQTGLLNDDFSTGNTNNWKAATAGSTGQIVNGKFVVTPAVQSSGKYRGDFQKTGGVTLHAGNYPIVAIRFNKPPRCNFFFDTNLGSYNNTNNNATKIASASGNIYYWDLSTGKLGTTTLSTTAATTLTAFQFKIADIVYTQAELAANDIQYEIDWVKTFASVEELRAYAGVNNPPTFAFNGAFTHPGLLHTAADLQRIKGFADNQYGRPYASYQLLQASSRSSATYTMAGPFPQITRDPSLTLNGISGGTIKNGVESDFLAAYYNALMYNITGNEAHALKSTQIIDAYAATTTGIVGADAELNGLYGFMLANAAELMRYTYAGWPVQKQQQAQTMLQSVFYPVLQNFRPCGHGNWDIICMKALMSIAIYSNDTAMFNRVVNYFYHGEGNGSIDNYVLTAAGQLQESNRDQPHVMLALGSMAELSEMALKQGVDLYSASGNAIMRGYEYTAKYNLGYTVDYQTAYDYCEKNYTDYTPEAISANGRGQFRAVFEIAYNHYVYSKGQQMPWTLKVLNVMGPEGAPFGADNPGYGSLFFYLNNAPNHPVDSTTVPVDTTLGLINDDFTTGTDNWAAATSGSTATVQNGELVVTLVTQSNGKKRGDMRRTGGATLFTPNYPILAIKFKKPQAGNITFDTNLGSYGNGANKWTGKIGEDVYYYDLTKVGFGAGPVFLSTESPTTLPTFQFKVADITSGEANYTVDWVKTMKSVPALQRMIMPLHASVQSFDGDNGQTTNNSIRPYLKLVNEDSIAVPYQQLTVRYWLTAENYSGISTWVDYAQLGNSKVNMKYVALDIPRNGAYGYIEYSFDSTAGNLLPGSNSGVIQSRLANADWSNLNETDDHSYVNNTAYTANDHITLYLNGQLIWGQEPAATAPQVLVKAYSAQQNSSGNSIGTFLTINNEGNVPVAYNDLAVRYWFTADGGSALNAWIDYAKLGNNNILRGFTAVNPVATGADQYLELKVNPALGSLYPASNTGNIQYRITKSDWSAFTQTNDHSYAAPAPMGVNDHITVYHKGQLIYGTEPSALQLLTDVHSSATTTTTDKRAALAGQAILFPNPTSNQLNIQVGKVEHGALVQVYTLKGELLLQQPLNNTNQTIALQHLAAGIYQVKVRNGKTVTTKQIVKQ